MEKGFILSICIKGTTSLSSLYLFLSFNYVIGSYTNSNMNYPNKLFIIHPTANQVFRSDLLI